MKILRNNFIRLVSVLAVLACGYFAVSLVLGGASGAMHVARELHTATLLANGNVLVAGGEDSGGLALASAELYDPATGTWTVTGSMNNARYFHTSTLLLNGKVLVAGGADSSGNSAELYDPATGKWTVTGSMTDDRDHHTATLLPNGNVLVVGGENESGAELYDPATEKWTTTDSMTDMREQHTATLLSNGKVLVVGGESPIDGEHLPAPAGRVVDKGDAYLASAELYDPATGTWTATGWLDGARERHTTTLLPNGKVLVVGGVLRPGVVTPPKVEVYDPVTGIWTATGAMNDKSSNPYQTATLLSNGNVLVGDGDEELYDPSTETWTVTGAMNVAHVQYTATLLPNGKVLVAGGDGPQFKIFPNGEYHPLASTELYDPATGKWTSSK